MVRNPLVRVVSDDKVIHSTILNLAGVQVLRTLAASAADSLRLAATDRTIRQHADTLRRDGLLILPNFLEAGHFDRVLSESSRFEKEPDRGLLSTWGPNHLQVVRVCELANAAFPAIHAFVADTRLTAIIQAVEKRTTQMVAMTARWETLTHGSASGSTSADPQTVLHSDVFYKSHKGWLYLDDVRADDGPLVYVKRSHRLSLRRLFFTYRDSCKQERGTDPSRRISLEERDWGRLVETIVTCPKNTLVIANVCGYHRRLQGEAGRTRRALSFSVRHHPFRSQAGTTKPGRR